MISTSIMRSLSLRSASFPFRGSPLRASAAPEGEANSAANRYRVSIQKPLGIVLEQARDGNAIFVESLLKDGAAAKTGSITEGDQLISTSGVIYTSSRQYGNTSVKGGLQVVQLNSFDAVMAAIGSHPGHIPVELEFERVVNTSAD